MWVIQKHYLLKKNGEFQLLTLRHNAKDKGEVERIKGLGGHIDGNGRVGGTLAVTRAFGDIEIKEYVRAHPYLTSVELTKDDKYLIMGCDGLFEVCSAKEISKIAVSGKSLSEINFSLLEEALAKGSTDNITIMTIDLGTPNE